MGKFTRIEFFFELLSGRNSKTVSFFDWFLGMVCSYKRYSLWIRQEKPRILNLVKNNLIFGCIFFWLARGAVGVLFFDVPEKHILVSDGRYWLYCVNRDAPGVHKKRSTIFQEYRMECALKSVDAGSSLRAASRKFNLPYSTLRRRFCNQANKIGRPPIFSEYQQRSLLKALSYQCLTFEKMRRRAYIFGKNLNVKLPATWNTHRTVGVEWMIGFLKKFSHLNLFIVKGKFFQRNDFVCVRCMGNKQRGELGFLCESCCLCTCKSCFRKSAICCVD